MIKVIHKKYSKKYKHVFYVGRGSALGNPYTSIKSKQTLAEFIVDSREESIDRFRTYLNNCIESKEEKVCLALNEIYKTALNNNVYISCYCSPKKCHGDIIKEIIENKIKEKSLINLGIQLNIFE